MKRLKNFSVHPIRGHKIRNQITRSAVYPGHNYHGKYVQRIYDLSPTFHPRPPPRGSKEPQRRVSALYFISGTLKAFSIADIVGFRGTRDGLSISWGE